MKKILMICHGNICRSTMAEFVMKDRVRKAGLEDKIYIESLLPAGKKSAMIPIPEQSES